MTGQKPDYEPWLACEGYVFRRHMLTTAKWDSGRLIADSCESGAPVNPENALKWIYDLLTAMDSKASALMRLNGVMLAAAAFLLSSNSIQPTSILQIARLDQYAILIIAAASAISILLCLYVVNVSWYFLGKVAEGAGKLDYTAEFAALQRTAKRRQFSYRTAWWVSFTGTILFVLEFLRQLAYVMFRWGF